MSCLDLFFSPTGRGFPSKLHPCACPTPSCGVGSFICLAVLCLPHSLLCVLWDIPPQELSSLSQLSCNISLAPQNRAELAQRVQRRILLSRRVCAQQMNHTLLLLRGAILSIVYFKFCPSFILGAEAIP